MPMSQLNAYLESIKEEKETKLIPENIVNGVTIMGVPGRTKYCIEVDFSTSTTSQSGMSNWVTKVNRLDLTKYNGTGVVGAFYGYGRLREASVIFTNKITNMGNFFRNCSNLKKVDLSEADTSNVLDMSYAFSYCYVLEDVTVINATKATVMNNMFQECRRLTNDSLNNILMMLADGTAIASANKTLKYLGLSSDQATICTTLSNWSAAQAKGWSTGY